MIDDSDPMLSRIVPILAGVSGVEGIVLGGSRARGTATAASDYDIGLYFQSDAPLDTEHLSGVVLPLVDDPVLAAVTPVGEWGPRIVGGAWLSIEARKVDLLYREIEAVGSVIGDCHAGRISMHYQPGHPHGFCSAIWMGEVAICRPLFDPRGAIAELKMKTSPYPEQLREALLKMFLWEVSFSIESVATAVSRGDRTHVAGCAYRALCCASQVLFALNRRYLINEKAALLEAADFPCTISDLRSRIDSIWSAIGQAEFLVGLSDLKALESELQVLAATDG